MLYNGKKWEKVVDKGAAGSMFFGEFEYRLDDKGRVPVPPRFRKELKDGLVLTPGIEKCITGYAIPEWKKLAGSLTSGALAHAKQRKLNRAIFATAFYVYPDGQGRIALPQHLRDYAGIQNDLVYAGANSYFELWNKDAWQGEKLASQQEAWQIIESLERRE